MSKKVRLKMLGRMREARKRLRDAAAGDLTAAEAEQADADERHLEAVAGVDEVKDKVVERLAETRTVLALLTFEHEHKIAVGLLGEAERERAAARDASERERARLVARARELKTAEKAIDRTQVVVRSDEKRAEQRLNDDLVGRVWRKES